MHGGCVMRLRSSVIVVAGIAAFAIGCHSATAPQAALTVRLVLPSSGAAGIATAVQIGGNGFQQGAVVTFGGATALGAVVNDTTITASAPPHAAGPVNVVVTNPDGQTSSLTAAFTYLAAPRNLAITGSTSLTSIGQTSQLTATATYVDGTTRDVSSTVQWQSTA